VAPSGPATRYFKGSLICGTNPRGDREAKWKHPDGVGWPSPNPGAQARPRSTIDALRRPPFLPRENRLWLSYARISSLRRG
jgi:hypothetical protein